MMTFYRDELYHDIYGIEGDTILQLTVTTICTINNRDGKPVIRAKALPRGNWSWNNFSSVYQPSDVLYWVKKMSYKPVPAAIMRWYPPIPKDLL